MVQMLDLRIRREPGQIWVLLIEPDSMSVRATIVLPFDTPDAIIGCAVVALQSAADVGHAHARCDAEAQQLSTMVLSLLGLGGDCAFV